MRTRAKALALVCVACLPAGAYAATVPILSGTYTLTQNSTCPIIATTSQNESGALTGITTTVYGDANGAIGTLTFTPAVGTPDAGTVTGKIFSYETGGLLQLPNTTLQPAGQTTSVKSTYSNTATTVTLVGAMPPAKVIYGALKDGIAQSFTFIGPSNPWPVGAATQVTCVDIGTVVHK